MTYHGLLNELIEMTRLCRVLGLDELPVPSTLCRAFNRLDMAVWRVLLTLSATQLPTNGVIGVDASGFDRSHAPKHYTKRAELTIQQLTVPLRRHAPARRHRTCALSIDPEVLLMDEPFGSLDEITARKLREGLLEIWKQEQKTTIFVTHDIQEAVYLPNRVGILSKEPAEISTLIDINVPRPRRVDNPNLPKYERQALDSLEIEE